MEFLNSVWIAISVPNPILLNICFIFLVILVEAPLSFSLIDNVFNIHCTRKQKNIYIITTGFIALLSIFILKKPYNIILNYALAFIVLFFIMKLQFIKSLLSTIFPSIIFNVLGILILKPYLSIFHITYEQANYIPIYRVLFLLLLYLVIFLCSSILKNRHITIKILDDFDKQSKSIIALNFIFGFAYLIFQGVLIVNYTDILPVQFTFFNFVSLLIYFGLSFFSLAKIMSLTITEMKLESVEEYNKTLHILHDSVRGFKHDFDNIVITIGGYIKTNDMKGLENYYYNLEADCKKVNNLYLLDPDIINNPGIYNLLTTKYNEAVENDITVNLTFLLDLNELHMKIYEFARILGILLDNAIESSVECEDKLLNIVFRNDSKNHRNIITIENTYSNKDVDLNNIFSKGITEKENHTGLGLWEVRQILKKNNNVNLHTTKNDKYFTQQLEIYY